jgi:hypothetical protein
VMRTKQKTTVDGAAVGGEDERAHSYRCVA